MSKLQGIAAAGMVALALLPGRSIGQEVNSPAAEKATTPPGSGGAVVLDPVTVDSPKAKAQQPKQQPKRSANARPARTRPPQPRPAQVPSAQASSASDAQGTAANGSSPTAGMPASDNLTVPTSITVISKEQIKDAQVNEVSDVIERTPNLFGFRSGARGHASTLNMRGVVSSNSDFANPAVGVVVDGMNIGGGYDFDFFDAERIEVLRGPQGTVMGNNAPGGVIRVISKRPTFTWENEADLTISSFGTFQERFAVGGPASDKVAFRLTGVKLDSDGYIQSAGAPGDAESRNDFNLRGQVLIKPDPNWDILLNLNGFSYKGTLASYAPVTLLRDRHNTTYSGYLGDQDQSAFSQILDASYRGRFFNFKSITSHRKWDSAEGIDADYTVDQLAEDHSYKSNDQYAQEFRFSSPDKDARLTWTGGVYIAHETQVTGDRFTYWPPLYGATAPSTDSGEMEVNQKNAAVFGQATYGLTEHLYVTAGLRYDYVYKEVESNAAFSMPGVVSPSPTLTGSESYEALLPKLALEYRWTKQFNTYASVARGYKPGGFPSFNFRAGNEPYDSEFSWNYEVGAKTSLYNDRLNLRASLFYIDLTDQQFTSLIRPNVTAISNLGKSHSQGMELEASVVVAPGLQVFAGLGITDAIVDELSAATSGAIEGGRLPNVPRYQATFGAQYRARNGFFARLDNAAVGSYYLDGMNTLEQDPYLLVNATLGWEFDRVQIYAFAKNLLDENYLVRAFGGTLPDQGLVGREGAPRTFGVITRVKF